MTTILERIVAETRADLALNPRERVRLERAITQRAQAPLDAFDILKSPGPHIIAEVKRSSPSAGVIREGVEPVRLAQTYAQAGAAAISVLTEPRHFGGSLDDLSRVSAEVTIPSLRKDFIIDEVQLLEARLHGASIVLLIVTALKPKELASLIAFAESLDLLALVEAHDADEVAHAVDAGARFIGVNNRNLHDFSIDLNRSAALRNHIPEGVLAVTESGINTPEDLGRLSQAGYDIFLIGTRLMSSDTPGVTLKRFREAGIR